MKYIYIIFLLYATSLSAQSNRTESIEIVYDNSPIGNSIHFLLNHKWKKLQFNYGFRYHLNKRPVFDEGQLYTHTMYAKNFFQHFGPTANLDLLFPIKNWAAVPFLGYHSQLGVMMRRVVTFNNILLGTWETFEEDSPLYRWENQLILGSYFPINKSLNFKLYGGAGLAGIFNIDRNKVVSSGARREFGIQFGLGLSYEL